MSTIVSTGELEKKSSQELVELYNSLNPPKPVKKFSDKPTAVKRCLALLGALQGQTKAAAAPAAPTVPKPGDFEKAKRTPPPPNPNQKVRFDLKPLGEIKPHREGTKRAKVVAMLTRPGGATLSEVMDACGWDDRTAYEGVKLTHTQLGYGISEDPVTHAITLVK